jgi:plastocyanin
MDGEADPMKRMKIDSHGAREARLGFIAGLIAAGIFLGPSPQLSRAASAASSSQEGSVEGTILFTGEIPKSRIPDDGGVRRDLIQVDRPTGAWQFVVVHLKSSPEKELPNPVSQLSREPVLVDQIDHTFVPRVIGIRAGETVRFANSDGANHNVRTSSRVRQNEFNTYTGMDGEYRHRFAAGQGDRPIPLGCDIHPWMSGWVYVFEHPWFAVTDERGSFRISGIPPGEYSIVIAQPDVRYREERQIEISAGKPTVLHLQISGEDLKASQSR